MRGANLVDITLNMIENSSIKIIQRKNNALSFLLYRSRNIDDDDPYAHGFQVI